MLDHVLSFISVAKAAGYTKAAQQTGISKAKLSRHVKELEVKLGIQLLHRTTRSFALTEQGRQFFESCQQIDEIYSNAIENLKRDTSKISGILKITAPIDFGIKFFQPIVSEYCKTYSQMDIQLSLTNVNENISDQQYDLAVRIANQLPDSSLRAIPIMNFTRVVCASPEYIKNNKSLKSPDDLKNHLCTTILNRNLNAVKPAWSFYINSKLKNFPLARHIECDSFYLQKQLIEAGTCIGRLPSYYIENELKSGKLIELLPKIKNPETYVYILYPNTISLPHKSRAFIDLMKKHLSHR